MANQPKKYTKFVATAATATLVASAIVPVASASFTDVSATNSHAANIDALVEAKIIGGYADGTFKPNQELTRGQVVKMLGKWVEAQGFTIPADYATVARFTDVAVDAKDQELVKYAALVKETGVFNGSNGALNAAGTITRENMAVTLDRAFKAVNGTSLVELAADIEDVKVADLATAKAEARTAVQALRDLGISGVENFNPKAAVTRGQFASFLNKTINVEVAPTELTLTSAVATSATTLDVVLSDESKHVVTLPTALEANKATEVKFTIGEKEYTATVTYVLEVKAATVVDATTLEVVLTDDTKHTVKLATALEANKATAVTFKINGVEFKATVTFVVEDLAVTSVSAINATQVEVKFNKAVKKSTVITGTDTLANVVFTSLEAPAKEITEANAKAVLSKDGTTLTITSGTNGATPAVQEVFEGRYQVVINNVEDTTSEKADKYDEVINLGKDVTSPTITATEKVNASTTKVSFSEPVATVGNFSFTLADGTVVPVVSTGDGAYVNALSADKKSLEIQIVGTQYAGKVVTTTVIGTLDAAGNLLSPNPATFTIQVGAKDGVAPKTTAVSVTNDKEVVVTFSEEVQGFNGSQLTISGTGIATTFPTVADVVQDKTNKNKYTVTYASSFLASGTTTTIADVQVVATGISDLTGEAMTAVYKQIVTVKKDTVAPELVSSSVMTEAGVKYLVLNFNEALTAAPSVDSATATAVKDFVTTTGTFTLGSSVLSTDSKTVKIALEPNASASPAITGSTFQATGAASALVEGTEYTVKLNATDTSNNSTTTPVTAKFTYAETASSDQPKVVTTTPLTGQNTVAITFDREVDGASATNAANYTINGVAVKSAILSPVSGSTQVVTLTLDTNTLTGNRAIAIANVKSKAGVAMSAFNGAVALTENVKPEVKSVKVTGTTTIEVTFSEAVTGFTDADDFVIKAGTTTLSYGTTANTAVDNVVTITLDSALTEAQLAETITLETLVGLTSGIKDAANNTVKTGTVTVVKN